MRIAPQELCRAKEDIGLRLGVLDLKPGHRGRKAHRNARALKVLRNLARRRRRRHRRGYALLSQIREELIEAGLLLHPGAQVLLHDRMPNIPELIRVDALVVPRVNNLRELTSRGTAHRVRESGLIGEAQSIGRWL